MRQDVTITSAGIDLAGWFYTPEAPGRRPAILMSHGISAVKEQGLDGFAAKFAAAGFAVLVIDYRHLGSSGGDQRGRIIPQEQHDDLRAALGWLSAQPGVDPARIGLWGTSYSGGHALYVGALDPRVKVVVAQVPAIDLAASLIAINGVEGFRGLLGMLAQDHAARNAGHGGGVIPLVAPAGEPAMMPTSDAYDWFSKSGAKTWLNVTPLESIARAAEYKPAAFIDLIAPRPLLIQAASGDTLIPIDHVKAAFSRAGEPKRLDIHDGGHFDFYPGMPLHDRVATDATAWFAKHL